jgi:hypothetical protein
MPLGTLVGDTVEGAWLLATVESACWRGWEEGWKVALPIEEAQVLSCSTVEEVREGVGGGGWTSSITIATLLWVIVLSILT